jgi:hypothetical protein
VISIHFHHEVHEKRNYSPQIHRVQKSPFIKIASTLRPQRLCGEISESFVVNVSTSRLGVESQILFHHFVSFVTFVVRFPTLRTQRLCGEYCFLSELHVLRGEYPTLCPERLCGGKFRAERSSVCGLLSTIYKDS